MNMNVERELRPALIEYANLFLKLEEAKDRPDRSEEVPRLRQAINELKGRYGWFSLQPHQLTLMAYKALKDDCDERESEKQSEQRKSA